jgi:hypothetical protein
MNEDYDPSEYDSGPYCQHWSELTDCEIVCLDCGHSCSDHICDHCDKCSCPMFRGEE